VNQIGSRDVVYYWGTFGRGFMQPYLALKFYLYSFVALTCCHCIKSIKNSSCLRLRFVFLKRDFHSSNSQPLILHSVFQCILFPVETSFTQSYCKAESLVAKAWFNLSCQPHYWYGPISSLLGMKM
jgi:hypothetical protein